MTRKLLVQSAQYWFDRAREAKQLNPATRLLCMENALNHTENALKTALDLLTPEAKKEWDKINRS